MPRLRQSFTGPPLDAFEINENSTQAANLVGWWPCIGPTASGIIKDYARGRSLPIAANITWARDASLNFNGGVTKTASIVTAKRVGWTMSFWCRPLNLTFTEGMAINCGHDGSGVAFGVHEGTLRGLANGLAWYPTSYALTTDRYHLAVINCTEAGLLSIYGNGVSSASWAGQNPAQPAYGVSLGYGDYGSRYFYGSAFDFRVYERALSAAEVWQLYDPITRWELYKPLRRLWAVGAVVPLPTVSVSQVLAEVDQQNSEPEVRISQVLAEVDQQNSAPLVTISQLLAEVDVLVPPVITATQVLIEYDVLGIPIVKAAQILIEYDTVPPSTDSRAMSGLSALSGMV